MIDVNVDMERGGAFLGKTPLDHYYLLRRRLFDPGADSADAPSLESLFSVPFSKHFQLTMALAKALRTPLHLQTAPMIPIQYPSGAAPLADWVHHPDDLYPKITENCQLALLWAILGKENGVFQEAAKRLAGFLEPLLESGIVSVWSNESTFQEDEALVASDLLLRALGKKEMMEAPKDSFYAWVYEQNVTIEKSDLVLEDPSLGYRFFKSNNGALAISASGKKTGAGALKIGSWSIPSFGPQGAPLSDPSLFGLNSAGNKETWFSTAAQPDAWFRILPAEIENGWSLQVDTVGLSAQNPLALAFYVKGSLCSVPGRCFKPASLQKYIGEGSQIFVETDLEKFLLSSSDPMKLEIIPLAGGNGFWGASFLIAFWLSPFFGSYRFEIRKVAK